MCLGEKYTHQNRIDNSYRSENGNSQLILKTISSQWLPSRHSVQSPRGKATIPWVKTRAGVPNLRDDQTKLELFTLVAKLVDASDSKSDSLKELCRFDSDLRYKKNK